MTNEEYSAAARVLLENVHFIDDPVEEFYIVPRTEMTLSQHPKFKRYHLDYNPITGIDHDVSLTDQERLRWRL